MKAVFHLTSRDPELYATVLRNAEQLLDDEAYDVDAVEVAVTNGGVGLVRANSEFGDRIESLRERGVVFKAGRDTLDRSELTGGDLVPGVEIVPSGPGELVRLQSEGYAYLRP